MPRAERTPREYELMIVVAPTVTDEGLPAVVERVSGYITAAEGSVARVNPENPWGRRRLAYKIQNFDHAYYVLYHFIIQPTAIGDLERELALDSVLIRHLIVRYDPLAERADRSPFDAPEPETENVDEESAEDQPAESADQVEADANVEPAEAEEAEETAADAEAEVEADTAEEESEAETAEDEPEAETANGEAETAEEESEAEADSEEAVEEETA